MIVNRIQAIEALYAPFHEGWRNGWPNPDPLKAHANAATIIGEASRVGPVQWQGEQEAPTDPLLFYARVSNQDVASPQSALSDGECVPFDTIGILFVQLFISKIGSGNRTKGEKLASMIQHGYRRTNQDIWFTNARIVDIAPGETWLHKQVIVDYEFHEYEEVR